MNKDNKTPKPAKGKKQKKSHLIPVLYGIAIALLVLIIVMMLMIVSKRKNQPVVQETQAPTTTVAETTTVPETTVDPTETTAALEVTGPKVMLENMAALYEQNPDTAGYIKIADTKLDYPVMYTPDDEEKYLYLSFEGKRHLSGLPFIDKDCSLDPRSDNLIIYGHNMANGTAFRTLMSYEQKNFWEEHPTFTYSTLYEEKTYEIFAVFYDRVYYKYEDHFRFYRFVDAADEEEFNEAITYFKEKSVYDTGITAEYGDKLITLVTCAYHVDNGRFVVVGREVTDTEPAETIAATAE